MIKKILSIDFDYIMYPCIKLYNEKCAGNGNPTEIWNILEHDLEINNFLSYDAKALLSIAKLIKYVKDNFNAIIIPIQEHQEIVDDLLTKDYNNSTYDLINIDYHHDIFYRKSDITQARNFNKYNCSNWVGYLFISDKINSYSWIKAPNSDLYTKAIKDIDYTILSRSDIDDYSLFDNIDTVYICFSPQWVPYKYKHLYDMIIELCK